MKIGQKCATKLTKRLRARTHTHTHSNRTKPTKQKIIAVDADHAKLQGLFRY